MSSLTLASPGAVAFHLGQITVRWYGIMIATGFLIATSLSPHLSKKRGIDPDALINAALICFLAGILGARLYFVALSWDQFVHHPEQILATWLGGLSIHGGIIGGVIAGAIYCKFTKLPFRDGLDVAAAVLPLAQAIGRWGNFFNSEAFGGPVSENFPLKLFIPENMRPPQFASYEYFHPTFLYESVWDLGIFFLLYFFLFDRLKQYPSMTFLAYLALYSIGRMIIEPLRTDSIMVGNMAAPYVVSAGILIMSVIGIIFVKIKGQRINFQK